MTEPSLLSFRSCRAAHRVRCAALVVGLVECFGALLRTLHNWPSCIRCAGVVGDAGLVETSEQHIANMNKLCKPDKFAKCQPVCFLTLGNVPCGWLSFAPETFMSFRAISDHPCPQFVASQAVAWSTYFSRIYSHVTHVHILEACACCHGNVRLHGTHSPRVFALRALTHVLIHRRSPIIRH